jgi:lysophospholipase L1-like esterase
MNREQQLSRLIRFAPHTIVFAGGLLIGVAALEALIRMMNLGGISYYQEVRRYSFEKMADPQLVNKHQPLKHYVVQGAEVHINDLGLRDSPVREKAESEKRILMIGDSVTFGWGTAQELTFPARLERNLTEKLKMPIRVINAGVGGYNTVQEAMYLENDGFALHPDLVMLTYVTNDTDIVVGPFDPELELSITGKPPLTLLRLLAWESWTYRLIAHLWRSANSPRTIEAYETLKMSTGWKASMDSLQRIAMLCQDRQIPLVVYFYRLQKSSFDEALMQDVREFIRPFPVEDTAPWFDSFQIDDVVISKVDSHPSAKGHEILANGMASSLIKILTHAESTARSGLPRAHYKRGHRADRRRVVNEQVEFKT